MSNTIKIFLTCPNCGDSNWIRREDDFECAACGDRYDESDMCATASDIPAATDATEENIENPNFRKET